MIRLPEKIRRTLEKIVKEMRVKEDVYGVGLFASWSRGDATKSSDVDLLVLDKGSFNHEFVERIEINGLLIDLDHVPKRWIHGQIPPELDQKLYEMKILYDRDWSLTNTKLLMAKSYGLPERVDIRTEGHVVESDIYLSRATSAFSRKDFQSAQLFATIGLENVLRVLMEVALEPFSNSHFIEKLEESTAKLGMHNLFDEYLEISGLSEVDSVSVEGKLKLFKVIWDEMSFTAKQSLGVFESSHFRVKTKLRFYLSPAFLQGLMMRTKSLVESGRVIETMHYLNNVLVDMVENYAWLKSSIDEVKLDYTALMRSLESLDEKNPENFNRIINFLDLSDVDKPAAADTIEKTRKIMIKIRKKRKVLIKNHLLKKLT